MFSLLPAVATPEGHLFCLNGGWRRKLPANRALHHSTFTSRSATVSAMDVTGIGQGIDVDAERIGRIAAMTDADLQRAYPATDGVPGDPEVIALEAVIVRRELDI